MDQPFCPAPSTAIICARPCLTGFSLLFISLYQLIPHKAAQTFNKRVNFISTDTALWLHSPQRPSLYSPFVFTTIPTPTPVFCPFPPPLFLIFSDSLWAVVATMCLWLQGQSHVQKTAQWYPYLSALQVCSYVSAGDLNSGPHSCTAGIHAYWLISSPILALLYNSNTGYLNNKT